MAQSVCAHVVLILVTKVVQFPLVQHWVRVTAFSFIAGRNEIKNHGRAICIFFLRS